MNIVLFDDPQCRADLLPFTFTRPVASIRVGIVTIAEKWEKHLETSASYLTAPYLQKRFPLKATSDNLLINGSVCPDQQLVPEVKKLLPGQGLRYKDVILAVRAGSTDLKTLGEAQQIDYANPVTVIDKPWKIFLENGAQIRSDFTLFTDGRTSAGIDDPHTVIYGAENIFLEDGVRIRAAVLNAEDGPIYLGRNATVLEGAVIKGAFALGESSTVNMGAKIRGDATVGPSCKVGGEISNSVIFGNTSKVHDGFIGNSVIGEWCNLGADTNTSNMKNNYEEIRLWSYREQRFVRTGLQFCGLMMGDHSKCGINTMFNTSTMVGVSANIFGSGFPRTFIPSFSWGGAHGFTVFDLEKAFATAERAMARRNVKFTEEERDIFRHIFEQTFKANKLNAL